MTARRQFVRLLLLVLLIVLVIAGLRGVVPAPRWNGPLKAYGLAIGIALEVVFGALLLVVRARDAAARRVAEAQPYNPEEQDVEPPKALRVTLQYVLGLCMIAVAVAIIADLHLHFFSKAKPPSQLSPRSKPPTRPPLTSSGSGSFHIPLRPLLYALLI